jgi:hypothetical protein
LFVAAGHGRSYGLWNSVLGHSLPGIAQCGLWSALAASSPAPTAALITDVGNDLLYGAPVPTILSWIETCLARLAPHCERLAIAQLPLASIQRLHPAQYRLLRSVFFPRCRLALGEVLDGASALNDGVIALAKKFSCPSVQPALDWFGYDPIHVRRSCSLRAWQALLAPWCSDASALAARGSRWHWLRLRTARAEQSRWLSWERTTPQPARRYADGGAVSFY